MNRSPPFSAGFLCPISVSDAKRSKTGRSTLSGGGTLRPLVFAIDASDNSCHRSRAQYIQEVRKQRLFMTLRLVHGTENKNSVITSGRTWPSTQRACLYRRYRQQPDLKPGERRQQVRNHAPVIESMFVSAMGLHTTETEA